MSVRNTLVSIFAVALSVSATQSVAKVSPEEAQKLKDGTLMPLGGTMAGNADGTIPKWDGGLTKGPEGWTEDGDRYYDVYPEDKPLFIITAANMAQYKDKLSAGQLELLKKYPDTYKIPVFQTRRSGNGPDWYYEATFKNATTGELAEGNDDIVNAITGIPFPMPTSGAEPIWNHKIRWRTDSARRYNNQLAVTTNGDFTVNTLREDVEFYWTKRGITKDNLENVIIKFLQVIQAPPRTSGQILLVHETLNQVAEPRRAWLYNPGQRRIRRAPNVGYDNPGNGADGLRTNDQTDMFNGAMDRYNWKLVGKKEIYIPYNSYRANTDQVKYKDLVKPGHMNQDHTRYELHRVWVVDSEVRPETSHLYKRRVFYVDEDSWTIALVDIYDNRDELWRFQEGHIGTAHHTKVTSTVLETVYDLHARRYLIQAINNEHPMTRMMDFPENHFTTANVKKLARK